MDPQEELAIELLANNYDTIFNGQFDVGPKIFVGPDSPIFCRFCKKSPPEITFRNDAHAIPELLGNRQLIVTDECDACNALFARSIEDHLGKYTKPYRVMGGLRGKKKIPAYKTKNLSRIEFHPSKGMQIWQHPDDNLIEMIESENRLRINFMVERHSPAAVYKALVKIALSVMPDEELPSFGHAIKWIRYEDHTKSLLQPLKLLLYFIPGFKPFRGVSVMLLRKTASSQDATLPHCMMILAFGNLQCQIIVPALADARGGENTPDGTRVDYTIPRYPSAFGNKWPMGAPVPAVLDLSSGEEIEARPFALSLHYGSLEPIK